MSTEKKFQPTGQELTSRGQNLLVYRKLNGFDYKYRYIQQIIIITSFLFIKF